MRIVISSIGKNDRYKIQTQHKDHSASIDSISTPRMSLCIDSPL